MVHDSSADFLCILIDCLFKNEVGGELFLTSSI
jgi:hypothetical protein